MDKSGSAEGAEFANPINPAPGQAGGWRSLVFRRHG
jgi:hypothetical protein